jgi:hypothetical protein
MVPSSESRHQSRSAQAISSGPLSIREEPGGAPFGDEPFDHRDHLVGADRTVDVHGEGLTGVFVDDVEQLQAALSEVSSN